MGVRTDNHQFCSPHTFGVPVNAAPFFYPGCPRCEEKKAAGKVRGDEGPVSRKVGWRFRRAKVDPEKFKAQAARERAGRAASRAAIPWK